MDCYTYWWQRMHGRPHIRHFLHHFIFSVSYILISSFLFLKKVFSICKLFYWVDSRNLLLFGSQSFETCAYFFLLCLYLFSWIFFHFIFLTFFLFDAHQSLFDIALAVLVFVNVYLKKKIFCVCVFLSLDIFFVAFYTFLN